MRLGKKIKTCMAFLAIPIMLVNSLPVNAAELMSDGNSAYGVIGDLSDESDAEDSIGTNAIVPEEPEPIGHVFKPGKTVVVKGTCVKTGTKTVYCAVTGCNKHTPQVTNLGRDKSNHEKWVTIDTPSTCTKKGQYGWKCDACKKSEISYKALLPHDKSNYINTEKGNCSKKNVVTWKCSCGANWAEETEYGAHGLYYVYEEPTVDRQGWEGYKCHYCNFKNVIATMPKLTPSDPEPMPSTPPDTPSGSQYYDKATEKDATNVTETHVGDPTNAFTGAHEIDFKVLSLGGAQNLTIGLEYKSNKSVLGVFGRGFSWNYESFIEEKDGNILLYHSSSDYVVYKPKAGTSLYVTEADGSELDELIKNSDGTYILKTKNRTLEYLPDGRLSKITEKTGEETLIEYKEGRTDLVDGVSGQKISLYFNDKNLVERVSNNASSEAYFEYNENGHLIKYTDPDGFVTKYSYDDKGQVITGTDNDGNVFFTDVYDETGRVVSQKDALGIESSFTYTDNGESGRTTVYTDRAGNTKTYTFDKVGRLLSLTDEEGHTDRNIYDERGNCIKKTDALGNCVLMEYDARDNLVKQTDALGNETAFAYDGNDNVVKITYPDESYVTFAYDSKNRLMSSTDLRGLETVNTYDENGYLIKAVTGEKSIIFTYEDGNLVSVTDSLGNTVTSTYDSNNHLTGTGYADGAVISQTVSSLGVVKSITDALGYTKTYTSNCFDKPLTTVDEDGNVITYEYDERQLLVKTTDSKGNETTYEYDSEENLIKTTYADGSFTTVAYDKSGKAVSSTDAEGHTSTVEYDACGRVIKDIDKNGNEATVTYDAVGNVTSRTDRNGNVTTYTYDSMGRVLTETNAFGGVTRYTYNSAGGLLSVTDPFGNVTAYTYDKYGNRTSVTDPNGNTSTFEYDLNGNLTKTTNALGEVTAYTYDCRNRLVSTKTGDTEVVRAYDLNGQIISTTDPNGNTSRTEYDKRGFVSKTIDALGNETGFVYDKNGNLVSSTNAKGQTTTYEVNNVNQVTSVTDALGLVTSFGYDKSGRRNKSTNPLGGVSTSIFDNKGNALELIGPEGGTTSFTYDANDNLTSRSTVAGNSVQYTYNALNLVESLTNARGQSTTYEYDRCGRIVKTTTPEGEITYTYDANSNVLTVTDVNGTITRTYDALNRVTSITDTKGRVVSYSYDSYGNLQTLTYPDNTSVTYTYDLCGNIKTVTDWEGRVTTYSYDALNREIESVTSGNASDAAGINSLSLDLSKNGYWESGEYDSKTGAKADHRRRMRLKEAVSISCPEYHIELTEGYKLRFCEYAENGSFLRSAEFTDGGVYVPGTEGKSFSITLIRISNEKALSPGQWGKIFADGIVIHLNAERQTESGTGIRTQKEYDETGNLVKTTVSKTPSGEVIDETLYEYDSIDRLVSERRITKNFKYEYSYDNLSRVLSRVTRSLQTGEVLDEETFSYDGAGNITGTNALGEEKALSYNKADNRINSFGGYGFVFDNDGNLISASLNDAQGYASELFDLASSNAELTYDSRNRLVQGVLLNGGHISVAGYEVDLYETYTEAFGYDAEDYRMYGSGTTGMSVSGLEGITLDTLYSMYESLSTQLENKALIEDIEALDWDEQLILPGELTEDTEESTEAVSREETDEAESKETEGSEEDAHPKDSEETNDESTPDDDVSEEPVIEGSVEEVPEVEDEAIEGEISEEPSNTSDIVAESFEEVPEEANIEEAVSEDDIVTEIEVESDILLTDGSGDDFVSEQQLLDSLMLQSIGEKAEIQESTTASEEDLWKLEMLEQLVASQQEVSITNEYCYDRESKNLLVRFSSDGTIEKYIYGNGLIASYEAKPTEETTTTDYRTYIYDIRGSVTEVANVTGNVTAEYRYSTYGNRSIISGMEFDEIGYCARDGVITEMSGLLYMRARYYYPALMRFINEDIVIGDISNSSSLNRYAYVNGNPITLVDPFGLCAEQSASKSQKYKDTEKVKIAKLKAVLLGSGWNCYAVTDDMVLDLYRNLIKYDITSEEQISTFLAQCMLETTNGVDLTEIGSKEYFETKSYGYDYRGGGYIHLTHQGGYEGFAIYLMLRDYPELKGQKDGHNYLYTSRDHENNPEVVTKRYTDIVDYAKELSIDVEEYKRIVKGYKEEKLVPADYVAENYAWESATYFWTISKGLNAKVANGMDIDDVSYRVLGGYSNSFEQRRTNYDNTKTALRIFGLSLSDN